MALTGILLAAVRQKNFSEKKLYDVYFQNARILHFKDSRNWAGVGGSSSALPTVKHSTPLIGAMAMGKMSKLAKMVREKAVIKVNSEHAFVTVDFPMSVTDSHDSIELVELVAEIYPLRNWQGFDASPEEDKFQVLLWWWAEDDDDECEEDEQKVGKPDWSSYPDDGELHLDQEGQRKLAELVRSSVVGDDYLFDDEELTKEEWFTVKYLVLDKDLYRLFGETALRNVISQVFPGWTVDCANEHDESSVGINLYSKPLGNTLKEAAAA